MSRILSVDKSLDIIETVAAEPAGIGTRALAKRLGINVTSVHNIAQTLVARGYLQQDRESRHFALGLRLMLLGRHSGHLDRLATLAKPWVRKVAAELDESIMLVALDHGWIDCIDYVPSSQALRVEEPRDLGSLAYCTASGKVMLAALSQPDLEMYLDEKPLERFTTRTLVSREALLHEIEEVRRRGYATAEGELSAGVSAVAVPVEDPWGRIVAALGASAPTTRFRQKQKIATLEALRKYTREIKKVWG